MMLYARRVCDPFISAALFPRRNSEEIRREDKRDFVASDFLERNVRRKFQFYLFFFQKTQIYSIYVKKTHHAWFTFHLSPSIKVTTLRGTYIFIYNIYLIILLKKCSNNIFDAKTFSEMNEAMNSESGFLWRVSYKALREVLRDYFAPAGPTGGGGVTGRNKSSRI